MSEQNIEQQVKDIYASQKIEIFSNLPRPELRFRHAQGHQRAGSLTGSMNIIQNIIITVFEVESQSRVNTKLWKRPVWFSEEIKKIFDHNFRDS